MNPAKPPMSDEELQTAMMDALDTPHHYQIELVQACCSVARRYAQSQQGWRPISEAPLTGVGPFSPWMILTNNEPGQGWIRMGHYMATAGLWYYSGTNERSQYNQIQGGAPTHFMPLPAPPQPAVEAERRKAIDAMEG